VIGRCARTNTSEFECRPMSAIKRTGYVRMHSVENMFFFFLRNIYILKIYTINTTLKIYTTNTQIKIFTHIFT
jgi:hypothetical protein